MILLTLTTAMLMATTTAGIGAPQFDESSTLALKLVNVIVVGLAIIVLWKSAFGKKTSETTIGPVPLRVQAHEEFITRREFSEVKSRIIAAEKMMDEIKDSLHQTELRLLAAGHEREEKLMGRINTLVPEVVRALDRTERTRGGRPPA